MAESAKSGEVDRREFLAMASVFGASTAMAYGMLGIAAPIEAQAQEPKKGGVLKVAMQIKAPRTREQPIGRRSPMPNARRWSRW